MSQRYNDNTKRPKPKENQLWIFKIYACCRKNQQMVLGPGESTTWVTYISMGIHPKWCPIFPLKVFTTLLSDSRKDGVGAQ